MTLTYTKPEAVLFDWDNTLADTWPIIHQAMLDTLTAMGHPHWTFEETKTNVHRSLRDAFPPMFGDRWEEARNIYYKSFLTHHLDKLTILEEAEDTLKDLKKAGIPMAVVSNKTGDYLREEVAHLGWEHYFTSVIGATDVAEDKPSAMPAHEALKRIGIKPGYGIWLVGDSITDLECAFNAGITPVFYGERDVPESYRTEFPHRVKDLQTLFHARNHGALRTFIREVGI